MTDEAEAAFERGETWHDLFEESGDPASLGEAVRHYARAVDLADPPDPAYLNGLGFALRLSYLQSDDSAELDRSIELLAAAARTGSDAEVPICLDNLARSLRLALFLLDRGFSSDRFVDGARLAVELTEPGTDDAAERLVWLGAGLDHRWEHDGDTTNLDEADAAFVAVERHDAATYANQLGVHHYFRHRAYGRPEDIELAVEHGRRAVALDDDDPVRAANLGRALVRLHHLRPDRRLLDEAIELLRAPLDLGNAHLDRFDAYGDVADLDAAVALLTEAAGELPADLPNGQAARNDLATALEARFLRGRDPADLSQARAALTEAIEARASAMRYLYVDNLANLEVDEFTMTGDPAWLDRASAHYGEALDGLADPLERRRVLTNSAGVYWYRWTATGRRTDLSRATSVFEAVVAQTPAGETGYVMRLNNLAVALVADPDYPTPDRIRALFAEATTPHGGDPLWAVRAAREWGRWAASRDDWAEAAMAYGRAQDAMGELVGLQRTRRHREHWLREVGGLPVEAAHASWKVGDAQTAVGRLDRGRGLLLSQALTGQGGGGDVRPR
ncbi:hypothetical protein [Actinoplanes sp. NPDC051411]|uniref:hypothetical protein n=1 Tax=Actinoplanes sp. NPDC051411 TaxID=3155522 RepID=UPI00341C0B11